MSVLNRAELLNELRLATESVDLGNGKQVIVSEIGAEDFIRLWTRPEYQVETGEEKDGKPVTTVDMAKFTPALVACSVGDEQGQRLFSDDDIKLLARGAQGPFMKLSDAARRLNGMAGGETKNSSETAPVDLHTGSVSTSE